MSTIFAIMYAFLLAAAIAAGLYLLRPRYSRRHLANLQDIRHVLSPPAPTTRLLLSRAIPNERLQRAFGITNTFCSPDIAIHTSFTRESHALISGTPNRWPVFASLATTIVDRHISEAKMIHTIPFDTFIRTITFEVVLSALFDIDIEAFDSRDVEFVTRAVNDLWRISKTRGTMPPGLLDKVNACLCQWVTTYPNPIDFVIPAYETMWRVVATTIAHTHGDGAARRMLDDFLRDPTRDHLHTARTGGPSIDSLIRETMRLHPPTRRISRATIVVPSYLPLFVQGFFARTVTSVADVEALHRDPNIWGPDADTFNPMRHHESTDEQKDCLLSFGYGRLQCIARDWAPHAAALIVAAILHRPPEGSAVDIAEGPCVGGREGWEGWRVTISACAHQ